MARQGPARRTSAAAVVAIVSIAAPFVNITPSAARAPAAEAVHVALVTQAQPQPTMSMSGDMRPGGQVTITSEGWQPGATVTANMDGTAVGSAVADSLGRVTMTMTMPANTSPGAHSMSMVGLAVGGGLTTITTGVSIGSLVGDSASVPTPVPADATVTG